MAQQAFDNIIINIAEYAKETRAAQEQRMESDVDSRDLREFESRLDITVKQLQEQLRQTAGGSFSATPATDPKHRLRQLRTIKAAYDQLTPSRPTLPAPGSVITSAVAAQTVQQTIRSTKIGIASLRSQHDSLTKQIAREEANLADARLLTTTIGARIARLRTASDQHAERTPTDLAREQTRAQQQRTREYDAAALQLRETLDEFIESHLAGMLAAEELGGPVVGELLDVDDDMLEAGFSQQGKPLKTGRKVSGAASDDRRQRRIDEIWGASDAGEDAGSEPLGAREAAAAEIRELVDELVDALTGEGETGMYVRLERDSAAARFLVRAKVAQFHPKDARRLRLVDFGRELDG